MKLKQINIVLFSLLLCCLLLFASCQKVDTNQEQTEEMYTVDSVPEFTGSPYVFIGDGLADFENQELVTDSFEEYSPLDYLGRCQKATACVGQDIMPTEERESIGQVKPTGWHTVKYDFVDGKYLYNRCHLIGFQLTGENANERNLITGTRYMNVKGMLPFENMVSDYVKETGNHVLYRVTPVFDGGNLVCRGVRLEAKSVEDGGDGIDFDVYVYNNQPGVVIDYVTGASKEATATESEKTDYVLNTNSKKFHKPDCESVTKMNKENKKDYSGSREALLNQGYSPCGICNP